MIYIILILLIFCIELCIKNHVEKEADERGSKPALHNLILLTKYHNYGAFRGLGEKKRTLVKAASIVLTVLLTISFLVSLGKVGKRPLKAGLAFLLGGAFSNTYDRIERSYVVDYFRINVKWKPLQNLIFNLSDFCIIIGALLVILAER